MILTWHIMGVLSETGVVEANTGVEYTLDKDYTPSRVLLRLKTAGATDEFCTIDINDDGVSIFDINPTIGQGLTSVKWVSFDNALNVLIKDSVITLDIDSISGKTSGSDLTVQLDLNEA